jgi:hypothetical protein
MSGRPTTRDVETWAVEVAAVGERIGRHFARSEPRQRAVGYVRGLLSDAARRNVWQLAECLGEATPDGVQHLLARADWARTPSGTTWPGTFTNAWATPAGC